MHMPTPIELLLILLLPIILLLAGCTSEPPEISHATITFGEIVSEPLQVDHEVYRQNNCGGSETTDYEVRRSRVIIHELELTSGFEVNAEGEVSVLGTGVALGAAVSGQIGASYGTADSMERAVTVRAAAGTRMEHEISHQEVWKTGMATVFVNAESAAIPFRYRDDFTLVLLGSRKLTCDDAPTPVPTYTPELATNPTTPFAEPTPTNTKVPPTPIPVQNQTLERISTSTPIPTDTSTPVVTNTPTKRPATASLEKVEWYDNCRGGIWMKLVGFTPNSSISVHSVFRNMNCETGHWYDGVWTQTYDVSTDVSGGLTIAYLVAKGDHNYTFTDSSGNRFTLSFSIQP
jgi:hypothetical protein